MTSCSVCKARIYGVMQRNGTIHYLDSLNGGKEHYHAEAWEPVP